MNKPKSAYLHIPFCHRRCFYCDFPVVPLGDKAKGEFGSGSASIKSYLNLLYREISLTPKNEPLSTVYIGGGTPSILSDYQIGDLLEHLRSKLGLQNGAEITLEVDPASFDENSLNGFIEAGINRVSLGGQSFDNNVLKELGRRHTRVQLLDACKWINESFKRGFLRSWSLDLMQNLPRQDIDSWKDQLLTALSVCPPHLSIYDLSIEKGTVFAWRKSRSELSLPNEEVAFAISRLTSKTLCKAGFSRYEISNYALPCHASRHNRVYWSGSEWLAFGQGATSCICGKRFSRPRTREGYKKWIENQEIKKFEFSSTQKEKLMPFDELVIVGLRRREGLDFEEMLRKYIPDEKKVHFYLDKLKIRWENAIKMGWINQRGYRYYLTDPDGMDISNQILVEMLLWWEDLSNELFFCDDPVF